MKKVYYLIYQRCILTSVLMVLCFTLAAQNRSAFRARAVENQSRQLRSTVTTSDTISLDGMGTIYSLSIDAIIHQPREASFTRIVLEDINGHDYLVAESDWFRNDTTTVSLEHFCEETALLEGIVPARLKCYLFGDATLTLSGIHTANQPAACKAGDSVESREAIKEAQVREIVDKINNYNERHNKMWAAGVTDRACQFGNDVFAGSNSYMVNMKYYIGGVYEFGEPSRKVFRNLNSEYVDSFTWCNRHGKDWITIPKNQEASNWCSIFAAVGAVEAMTNLYFNDTLNLDLSEQDVANNLGIHSTSSRTYINRAFDKIQLHGIIDEASFPTFGSSLPSVRPDGEELIYINGYDTYLRENLNEDTIKHILINKGPLASGVHNPSHYHSMTLVGYNKIKPNLIYYMGDEGWYRPLNDKVGQTCWIFKNSYYGNPDACVDDIDGFMYAYFYNLEEHFMDTCFTLHPTIIRIGHTDEEIVCEDIDGDGFYNWGLGTKPEHCPAWAPDISDGDDSDRAKGHMNEYGFCEELSLDSPMYQYIQNDSTLTQPENRTNYLGVLRGATVTLQAQQTFANGTQLLLDNGSTLIINGVTINGSYLRPYPGSKIILNNGAKIQKPFEVPIGVELVINYGSIE